VSLYTVLEHAGVAIAAVTGALAARGRRVDLFGVIVLSMVTALGGGTMRDLTIGAAHVFWVEDAAYLYTGLLTAVGTFFIVRYVELPRAVLLVADAFVLAFFTIVGQKKALALEHSALVSIVMGVMTGVAGGMIRDLMLGDMPLVFRPETFLYATAAAFGTLLYTLLLMVGINVSTSTLSATGAILLLRLIGIRWRITLPVFATRADDGSSRPPTQG
jgi:uncharacterized membrane protein YeiH